MKWKSSAETLTPSETCADGLSAWKWTAQNYAGLKREPNTPSWYVSAPWIQISDCADWHIVAENFSQLWAKQKSDAPLDELIKEVEKQGPDLPARIEKAIELIQDGYRYLSMNLEFGGMIPAPPEVVTRRRYGDCKSIRSKNIARWSRKSGKRLRGISFYHWAVPNVILTEPSGRFPLPL